MQLKNQSLNSAQIKQQSPHPILLKSLCSTNIVVNYLKQSYKKYLIGKQR
jgi:hypothetical protein